jgi:uncharacterized protein YjhX (UPF0386 family)
MATATPLQPWQVRVPCGDCRQGFPIDRGRLRELVDADQRPRCPGCEKRAARAAVLSKADKVLLAVSGLGGVAHKADVAVAAWATDPAAFGLEGHTYPDSHDVNNSLQNLKGRGLVESAGVSRYRLTEAGRARVAELQNGGAS